MVNLNNKIRDRLFDIYPNIREIYSIEDKQKYMLIIYSLVAESYTALEAFREIDDRLVQPREKFIDEYLNNEKRHKYRTFLASAGNENKYKELTFKFANSRNLMMSKKQKDKITGLLKFKDALFEALNYNL